MSADLGTFEDLPITGHALKLVKTGDGLSKALMVSPTDMHAGDTIDLLIRAKAGSVNMKIDDEDSPTSWIREQVLSALTISVVSREFADDKIAEQVEAEAKAKEADERKRGIVKLPGMALDKGAEVHVDENYNVLTDAEVAQRRGMDLPVFDAEPVILEMENDPDNRMRWPDDFPDGGPCPQVGDLMVTGTVTSLLHFMTGQPLSTQGGDDDALIDDTPAGSDPAAVGDVDPDPSCTCGESTLRRGVVANEIDGVVHRLGSPCYIGEFDAGEPDPALADYLAGTAAEIKVRLAGVMSVQWLDGLYDAELAGDNRKPVLNAIEGRLAEIEGV